MWREQFQQRQIFVMSVLSHIGLRKIVLQGSEGQSISFPISRIRHLGAAAHHEYTTKVTGEVALERFVRLIFRTFRSDAAKRNRAGKLGKLKVEKGIDHNVESRPDVHSTSWPAERQNETETFPVLTMIASIPELDTPAWPCNACSTHTHTTICWIITLPNKLKDLSNHKPDINNWHWFARLHGPSLFFRSLRHWHSAWDCGAWTPILWHKRGSRVHREWKVQVFSQFLFTFDWCF